MKNDTDNTTGSDCPAATCSPLRDAFEAWISSPPFERETTRYPKDETKFAWPGSYRDYEVQIAWDAWREGAKYVLTALKDPHRTHALMMRGDIGWSEAGLKHLLGISEANAEL